jgi:hypothetical protein
MRQNRLNRLFLLLYRDTLFAAQVEQNYLASPILNAVPLLCFIGLFVIVYWEIELLAEN